MKLADEWQVGRSFEKIIHIVTWLLLLILFLLDALKIKKYDSKTFC